MGPCSDPMFGRDIGAIQRLHTELGVEFLKGPSQEFYINPKP